MTSTGWARGHRFRIFPRKISDEEKKKKSDLFKGKSLSEEHKAKISASRLGQKGHKNSKEHLEKLSLRWSGEKNPKWQQDREALKLRQKLRSKCHFLVKRTLSHLGGEKSGNSSSILGYSPDDLKIHIENLWKPGMTWQNYGYRGWHIDHVKPVCAFSPNTDPAIVNSLENLQPLWCHENLSKGSTFE